MNMDGQKEKESWWKTLPGILTGIGTTLAGLAALIAVLVQLRVFNQPKPPVTTIDVDRIVPMHQYETGFIVALHGTVTDSQANTYVVVKPDNDARWYIQPPAPVTIDGQKWRGNAYLGEEDRGIGVSFKILVIKTIESYQGQQPLTTAPSGKITNTINCIRVR